jgi:hypothetical protein
VATKTPQEYRQILDLLRLAIDGSNAKIEALAREVMPDYHFMRYKVSLFWSCEQSPLGMCVFTINQQFPHNLQTCRYCGGPVERK